MTRYWLAREWKAVVTISLVMLAFIGFGLMYQYRTSGIFDPVPAVITGIGNDNSYSGIYTSSKIVVVAMTEDGLIGRASVAPAMVRGCEVGDSVRAEKKGRVVKVHPYPCQK